MLTQMPSLDSWVICPKPNPQADLRLFCFPYAGGSSFVFRTWPGSLPLSIEVCSIELPGRGSRMKLAPIHRLEPLVSAIASAIQTYSDKPFAFFGHSMGGLVSFEVARLLRKQYGISPVHMFISGRRAPQVPSRKPPIHALSEPEFIAELRLLNGTPPAVLENAELMQLLLPILRADFAVLETYLYSPEPPLECPITVFGGLEDSEANREELQAWQQHTNAAFGLQMYPGDHFFIHSHQPSLLAHLAQQLQVSLLSY